MTCVVGFKSKDENKIYIGADTLGSTNYTSTKRDDGKVFAVGDFTIGFTSSYRMGQVLQYKLDVPEQKAHQSDHEYMATTFVDEVRELFKENGILGLDPDNKEFGGLFIVAYKNELYRVDYDFQVGMPSCGYTSCGSGGEVALGAMYALDSFNEVSPTEKISIAIMAAMELTPFVGGDIDIISHEYLEEKEVDRLIDKLDGLNKEEILELRDYLELNCESEQVALGVDECEQ